MKLSSCDYFVLHIQISLFAYSCVTGLWHFSLEQVSVDKVSMKSFQERDEEINRVAEIASVSLKSGKDTLLVTSRQLVTGKCQYFSFLLCLCIFFYLWTCAFILSFLFVNFSFMWTYAFRVVMDFQDFMDLFIERIILACSSLVINYWT